MKYVPSGWMISHKKVEHNDSYYTFYFSFLYSLAINKRFSIPEAD